MRRARFIGGPEHGKLRILPDERMHICFPVWDNKLAWCSEFIEFPEYTKTREIVYTRRTLGLGSHCRVELWAPQDMGEPEFMRRVADLLEGIGEPTK